MHRLRHDRRRRPAEPARAIRPRPNNARSFRPGNGYKPLIASLGHLGRHEEAAPYIQKLLSLEPDFTVERFRKAYPFKRPEDRENYCEGLRLAGIPKH
jgi:hypothetical protein